MDRARRKVSLRSLRSRLRTTAEPTFRLIAQPSRASPGPRVRRAITVKQRVRTRTPSRWMRRNSQLLRMQAVRGKRPVMPSDRRAGWTEDDIGNTATSDRPTPKAAFGRGGGEPPRLFGHWPSACVYENRVYAFALSWTAERCASLLRSPPGWFFRHDRRGLSTPIADGLRSVVAASRKSWLRCALLRGARSGGLFARAGSPTHSQRPGGIA